jgi:hypothetical protein
MDVCRKAVTHDFTQEMIATQRRSLGEPPANGDPVSENPEIHHCVKSH